MIFWRTTALGLRWYFRANCAVIFRRGIAFGRASQTGLLVGLFLLQLFFFFLLFRQFFLAFLESVIGCGHSFLSS